ncbi:hypothetical protein [Corynebacterium pilosum]|uniref:hypothetical protein n=1 Tax=Corynebacterium pilosum TaxID=35756 RepID=UPI00128E5B21|nr:hypothetical protein [Corynebacterium pilosum]
MSTFNDTLTDIWATRAPRIPKSQGGNAYFAGVCEGLAPATASTPPCCASSSSFYSSPGAARSSPTSSSCCSCHASE